MKKNGYTFFTIANTCQIESGVWNPYHYKENKSNDTLSDFANIKKIKNNKQDISISEFAPIEYKNIPKGELLTFSLEDNSLKKGVIVWLVNRFYYLVLCVLISVMF